MNKILFTILIAISLYTDAYSQRIPFGFWNSASPDSIELAAPRLISPADDATNIPQQDVLLDWDGVVYATNYIVQLSAEGDFTSPIWADTTVNSKAVIELGLEQGSNWYWRVLAYNIFDTSDWSDTNSFTVTTGPALTTPLLTFPADGATGISQLPVLDWDTVENVRHYVVQLSASTSFSSLIFTDSITVSTATVDTELEFDSTYYWRVIAYNNFDTSDWSDTNSFTVTNANITAPTLITPANGDTGVAQSPTLYWSKVEDADFYNIQLTQYSDFSSVFWNTNSFDTLKLVTSTLLNGTKWYWRARSINVTDTSAWSSSYAFIVTEGSQIARAYYIDATTGRDEYNGRSTTSPWQTLAKVTARTFVPGDTILLKGGQTFSGDIRHRFTHDDTVNAMTYGSYGTGKAKILLGTSDSIGINIQYTKHIKVNISDLIIEGIYDPINETGGSNLQAGIFIWNYTTISPIDSNKISQININNCEIHNIKNSGINIVSGDFGKTITCHIDSNIIYNLGGAGIGMTYNWHSNSRIYGNTIHDIYGLSSNVYDYGIVLSLCKGVTIERNLLYNIGYLPTYSGIGIQLGACKSVNVKYNEIYNVINNSFTDCEAINFENGTDSCIAEFNYIHDTPGMGILISGNTSYYSLINSYKSYAAERGSIDSGSADYNVIRYNLFKNLQNSSDIGFMAIKVASGITMPTIPGKNNQVYNNTIIYTSKRQNAYGIVLAGSHDSTKIFNNLIIGDSLLFFYSDSIETKRYAYINNNMYWDREKMVTLFLLNDPLMSYNSFNAWNTATGWEATKYNYNPLLADPYSTLGDTLNNPFLIETLSKYVPVDGSLTRTLATTISAYTQNVPTTDIRGLSVTSNKGIGAFIDTTLSPYRYNDETKRWVSRMDTLQTAAQMKTKDSLMTFMLEDTLLTKMDLFYIFANIDSSSAKLNVLKDTFNITTINSPTFTPQYGYTGNGSNSYLNTTWTPSINAVKYLLDSANVSVYSMSNIVENKSLLGTGGSGVNFIRITPNNASNKFLGAANQTTLITTDNITTIGLFSVNRTASNSVMLYKSDTMLLSATTASASLSSSQLFILARNGNGVATDYTTGSISMAAVGGKLNDYSQYALTDNIEWYLNRIGVSKYPLKVRITDPANNDTGVSLTTDLKWARTRNKTSFHIQISYQTNFSTLIGEMTDVDTNVYHVGGTNPGSIGGVTLVKNRIHYWRVRAVNSAGYGAWSNIFTFTTLSDYAPESVSLFSRFPYAISAEKKDLIDSLIQQLKADTIWSKTDIFYMYAADDTSNAKLNWKSSSYTSTLSGTVKPTFTANQGFAGDGSSSYIKTGWIPNTHGVNYLLDSASVFIYVRTAVKENKTVMGTGDAGVNFVRLNPQNTLNQIESRMNESTNAFTTSYNPMGLYSMIRYNASTYKVYKNDTVLATVSNASTSRPSFELYTLARNSVGTATDFTTRQVAFIMAGGKFTDYKQTVINRRIEWYLNRIGACVLAPSYVWLTSPANTATGVNISPDFDWDNVGANYYQIEIDDDIAFGSPYYSANTPGSEESGENIGGLANNTTYYWRVRGVNNIGTGAWSSTFSFTTTP